MVVLDVAGMYTLSFSAVAIGVYFVPSASLYPRPVMRERVAPTGFGLLTATRNVIFTPMEFALGWNTDNAALEGGSIPRTCTVGCL